MYCSMNVTCSTWCLNDNNSCVLTKMIVSPGYKIQDSSKPSVKCYTNLESGNLMLKAKLHEQAYSPDPHPNGTVLTKGLFNFNSATSLFVKSNGIDPISFMSYELEDPQFIQNINIRTQFYAFIPYLPRHMKIYLGKTCFYVVFFI